MPSRWFSAVILLGWLATTSWLVYSEVLPLLMPGTPPAFAIDLVEEVQLQHPVTRWVALRYDKKKQENVKVFRVETHIQRVGDNVFEMTAKYSPYLTGRGKTKPTLIHGILITRFDSTYRVNSAGDLLGVKVFISGEAVMLPFSADIRGEVKGGEMAAKIKGSIPGRAEEFQLNPVKVPRGGSMLMPLHPVNRIKGLRLGQAWTMFHFDAFKNALPSILGDTGPGIVRAHVRARTEQFEQEGGRMSPPCYVIDYTGDNLSATTWVDEKTGRVLRQEAAFQDEHWQLVRD